jgi:hypothetical protein
MSKARLDVSDLSTQSIQWISAASLGLSASPPLLRRVAPISPLHSLRAGRSCTGAPGKDAPRYNIPTLVPPSSGRWLEWMILYSPFGLVRKLYVIEGLMPTSPRTSIRYAGHETGIRSGHRRSQKSFTGCSSRRIVHQGWYPRVGGTRKAPAHYLAAWAGDSPTDPVPVTSSRRQGSGLGWSAGSVAGPALWPQIPGN